MNNELKKSGRRRSCRWYQRTRNWLQLAKRAQYWKQIKTYWTTDEAIKKWDLDKATHQTSKQRIWRRVLRRKLLKNQGSAKVFCRVGRALECDQDVKEALGVLANRGWITNFQQNSE